MNENPAGEPISQLQSQGNLRMKVEARKIVKKMKGGSGSYLMECDDDRSYVVKFKDGSKNVVSEFIGGELANALQLPAQSHAIVEVGQELIETIPDHKQRGITGTVHHGTLFNENALDLDSRNLTTSATILNAGNIPGVVTFDNLTQNNDRNNAGNNLFVEVAPGTYSYVMCDYNCMFNGSGWSTATLTASVSNINLMPVHPILATAIAGLAPFDLAFDRITKLSTSTIHSIIETIPSTWSVTRDEQDTLVGFLESRKKLVPQIILANKSAFPKWGSNVV